MTKEEALKELRRMAEEGGDAESNHVMADKILLELINDPEIIAAYYAVGKWYS